MSTQKQPAVAPAADDPSYAPVYDIRISERQRFWLHKALALLIATDPGYEEDGFGNDIPTSLEDLLNLNGSVGPLVPVPALNSFVV